MPEKTPDPVVAATAMANSAILVAIDKDMKRIAQRYGATPTNDRFAKLSLIRLCCEEGLAAKRLLHALSFVEHEWIISQQKTARCMWVESAPISFVATVN